MGDRAIRDDLKTYVCPSAAPTLLQMKHFVEGQHALVWRPSIQRLEKRRHIALPSLVDFEAGHTAQGGLKIGRFEIPDQQAVGAQKQGIVPPSGFTQGLQHLRPDGLVAPLILVKAIRAHFQEKTNTFHHFTSTRGIFKRNASLAMRASVWPTPSAQWCVGPSIDQRLMNSAGPRPNLIRELVLPMRRMGPGSASPWAATSLSPPAAVSVRPRMVTGPVFTWNSTETPEPRLPWYRPRARSTGRASPMAMWPGPSCPIKTKFSRKSMA